MRKTAFDLAWGLIGFLMVLAVSVLTREHQDIRLFTLATFVAFFCVASFRAHAMPQKPWLTSLLVGVGGILPLMVMNRLRIAFTSTPFFVSFLGASGAAIALGAAIGRLSAQRKMRSAGVFGFVSLAAVLLVVFQAIPRWMEGSAYRTVDQSIAPFTVETLTGKQISSEEWKGRVVVLSFWATWCTPCQAELPEIAKVEARFRDNPDVLILALNAGRHGETPAKAQAYLERRSLMLPSAMDSSGVTSEEDSWGQAAKRLGVESLPTLCVLDRSGRLRIVHLGYDSSEHLANSLTRRIEQIL